MSDDKDPAQKEAERLMKSLNRTQSKSAAERKQEEAERQRKYAERKKKEEEDRAKHEEQRKKDMAAKEEQRKKEQALEREREVEDVKKNENVYVPEVSDDALRKEEDRLARAFKGNVQETHIPLNTNKNVDSSSLPTNFSSSNSEDEALRKEEERMAKMFGQQSSYSLENAPPALRSHAHVDPNPYVVKITPQSEAQMPPALRMSPRGDNAASMVPQALRTVVVPAAVPVKKDAEFVGTYKLPAYGGEASVELDCSASRKFWTVKVLPCKYNTELTVQLAGHGGTVDFLPKYNGGVHPRSVDLPMLVRLRPDCVSLVSQDPTGITFQINV